MRCDGEVFTAGYQWNIRQCSHNIEVRLIIYMSVYSYKNETFQKFWKVTDEKGIFSMWYHITVYIITGCIHLWLFQITSCCASAATMSDKPARWSWHCIIAISCGGTGMKLISSNGSRRRRSILVSLLWNTKRWFNIWPIFKHYFCASCMCAYPMFRPEFTIWINTCLT